jgi:hypothetical protein
MLSWTNLGVICLATLLGGLLGTSCTDNKGRDSEAAPQGAAAPGISADEGAGQDRDKNVPEPASQPPAEPEKQPVETKQIESAGDGDDILDRHWQDTVLRFEKPLSMSMELRRAEFNPAEKAKMSILYFEASCQVGRKDWLSKEIVMDSLRSTDSAELKLDICSVELMPLLRNPVATGRTASGGTSLRMDGGLKFIVRDPAGALMGTFLVNNDGEIYEAETGELYAWRISRTDQDMLPSQYLFYRNPGAGETIKYLIAISYQHGSNASKTVKDPLGNEIMYVFPNGIVEIGPPEAPERKRRNPEDDYRK